jgi:O-antigen/teichoic acid export membrane protein
VSDPTSSSSAAPPPASTASKARSLRKLLVNTSAYTLGNLLVMAGSFVTFPILTRLLTVEEYGLMGLVTSTLTFLVAVAKVGVQASAVRFYSKITAEAQVPQRTFYSTVFFGMSATGALATLLWLLVIPLIPDGFLDDPRVHGLFQLTAVLVMVRVLESSLVNIFRAQQRAAAQATFLVVKRYAGIGITLFFLLVVSRSVHGFYYGMLVNEILAVAVLAYLVHRFARFSTRSFSPPLFKRMLLFGLPLVGSELGSILLQMGDRYVIQAILGATAVGHYTAAYNLCEYAEIVVIASVGTAIGPIYTRLYDEQGREATEAFLSRSLRYYFLIGIPLVAGMSAVGPEALVFLASEKYADGVVVIPWVTAGTFVSGLQAIAVAGIYIAGRTLMVMALVVGSAILNIALNLALLPIMGIEGAGVATLVSYIAVTAGMEISSRSVLHVRFPWLATVRFTVAAVVMYVVVRFIRIDVPLLSILAKVVAGAILYAGLLVALDAESRELVKKVLNKLRGR